MIFLNFEQNVSAFDVKVNICSFYAEAENREKAQLRTKSVLWFFMKFHYFNVIYACVRDYVQQ